MAMSLLAERTCYETVFVLQNLESDFGKKLRSTNKKVINYYDFFILAMKTRNNVYMSFGIKALIITSVAKLFCKGNLHVLNIRGEDKGRIRLKTLIYRSFIKNVDLFVSNSQNAINVWESREGISLKRAFLIHNLIPNYTAPYPMKDITYNLIVLANLKQGKGFDHLVNLVESNRIRHRITIGIYGKVMDTKVLALINGRSNNSLVNVKYFGFTNHVESVLAGADCLLSLSDSEGIPNSFIEAIQCKTPIISSNVGGVKEIVIHKLNGLLFKPGDYLECADLINELYDNSGLLECLRSELYLDEKFSDEVILGKWHQVWSTILD